MSLNIFSTHVSIYTHRFIHTYIQQAQMVRTWGEDIWPKVPASKLEGVAKGLSSK